MPPRIAPRGDVVGGGADLRLRGHDGLLEGCLRTAGLLLLVPDAGQGLVQGLVCGLNALQRGDGVDLSGLDFRLHLGQGGLHAGAGPGKFGVRP